MPNDTKQTDTLTLALSVVRHACQQSDNASISINIDEDAVSVEFEHEEQAFALFVFCDDVCIVSAEKWTLDDPENDIFGNCVDKKLQVSYADIPEPDQIDWQDIINQCLEKGIEEPL